MSASSLTLPLATTRRVPGAAPAFGPRRRPHAVVVAGLVAGHAALVAVLLAVHPAADRPREPALVMLALAPPPAPPAPREAPRPLPKPSPHLPPALLAVPALQDAPSPLQAAPVPPAPPAPMPPVTMAEAPHVPPVEPAGPAGPAAPRLLPPSAVQYAVPPAPVYARASARQKEHGRVMVRVWIDESGLPQQVALDRSSGFARLDESALAAVRAARFRPPTENGQALAGWAFVPIDFELGA